MESAAESGFRFQNLVIWQRAADLAIALDEVSDQLDERRKYRFAEQLRAAGLSISNNIAEGSGSNTTPEFADSCSLRENLLSNVPVC